MRWLEERLPLAPLRDALAEKSVPVHRYSVFYYLGGMTLFFFVVQVVTGILLMLYYRPSAEEAFESVEFIMTTVPFGWLVRSIHSWSANLMIFFACLHLATVFFIKAYRKPRELTWITGCLLLALLLGFGFSGYLLPWNQLAFFATKVGTDIAGSIPWIGEAVLRFLRGGDQVTGGTLSRFYGWHVAILPALATLLVGLHLLLVQVHGMHRPAGQPERRPMRFVPDFLLRDLFGWTLALGVLATLAALFPWELGEKADPFAPAYADIKPEWYFMFMFQTLKLVPGGEIAGIEYEAIPILGFTLAGLLVLLVPFIDRGGDRRLGPLPVAPAVSAIGALAVAAVVAMTAWGYHSAVPFYVVAAAALLMVLLGWVTAPGRRHGAAALLLALGAATAAGGAEPVAATSCTLCHGDLEMVGDEAWVAMVEDFGDDVHAAVGLSCHDCHGGDPDPALADDWLAMDPDAEPPFLGTPARREIPAFCGRCHSDAEYMQRFHPGGRIDQESEYYTSRHGEALARGDERVATCVDCHGTHGIRRAADPRSPVYPTQVAETCGGCHADPETMAGSTLPDGRPLPIDQLARWRRSAHGLALVERADLFAPTCNDCHGNHGATPPGLDSISFVCGQCHGREASLFRTSAKRDGFEMHNELGVADLGADACAECHEPPAAEFRAHGGFSECATCHGNHSVVRPTVAMLGPLPATPCALCHETGGELAAAHPEDPAAVARYQATRDALLAEAAAAGLEGDALFDRLVDRAEALPQHTVGAGGGERRGEFARLFEKFRIGKTHHTWVDPASGETVREAVVRCTDCHGAEADGGGYATSAAFLTRMQELTALTARAERLTQRARRGGVEIRGALLDLDQAVDSQIELEVLVHAFDATDGAEFAEKHAEGLEHADAALGKAEAALGELVYRRRGLALSLVFVLLVLIALGLKIRSLG